MLPRLAALMTVTTAGVMAVPGSAATIMMCCIHTGLGGEQGSELRTLERCAIQSSQICFMLFTMLLLLLFSPSVSIV